MNNNYTVFEGIRIPSDEFNFDDLCMILQRALEKKAKAIFDGVPMDKASLEAAAKNSHAYTQCDIFMGNVENSTWVQVNGILTMAANEIPYVRVPVCGHLTITLSQSAETSNAYYGFLALDGMDADWLYECWYSNPDEFDLSCFVDFSKIKE